MVTLEKPNTITVTIADRKTKKYKSFVVYGATIGEVEKKIKETLKK
jgi:hypothetical protein